MDTMQEDENVELNMKAIGLAIGGAALAGLLFVLARREEKPEPTEQVEAAIAEAKGEAKKAAKAAKKKQKKLAEAATKKGDRLAHDVRDTAESLGIDTKAAERDLKAAAWDAQQAAKEAEGRLTIARQRVVDDAAQIAARVGTEARHLAGEGKERIAHLRHRGEDEETADQELARLRAEIADLRGQLASPEQKSERDFSKWTSRLAGKTGPIPEDVASQAASAALAHLERTAKAVAPELLTAKNRAQVIEILQRELGPTVRDSMAQAAAAALGLREAARERAEDADTKARAKARDTAAHAQEVTEDAKRHGREAVDKAMGDVSAAVDETAESVHANGKRGFWRSRETVKDVPEEMSAALETPVEQEAEEGAEPEGEHKSKAGLFWGGAGLGLALYALLDAERRDRVLRLANEASVQVQELVRDLQGYDDEF